MHTSHKHWQIQELLTETHGILSCKFMCVMQSKILKINSKKIQTGGAHAQCASAGSAFDKVFLFCDITINVDEHNGILAATSYMYMYIVFNTLCNTIGRCKLIADIPKTLIQSKFVILFSIYFLQWLNYLPCIGQLIFTMNKDYF